MDINNFWQLIDQSRIASNGDTNKQADFIIEELAELSLEEMSDYQRIFDRLYLGAYRYDLRDVADLIYQGLGDSGLKDFRAWLIGQGQIVYENALVNPESLADIVSLDKRNTIVAEKLGAVCDLAYQKKTNSDDYLPYVAEEDNLTMGRDLKEGVSMAEYYQRVKETYPKVWAKFGW